MTAAPDFMPVLSHGSHFGPSEGACVMEYVSVLAGEKFTDRPACTLPVFTSLAIRLNDSLDDSQRQRMVPLIPRLIGTATDDPHTLIGVSVALLRELDARFWQKFAWWPAEVSRELGKAWHALDRWARREDVSVDELCEAAATATATATATAAAAAAAATAAATAAAATAFEWYSYKLSLDDLEATLTAGLDAFDECSGRNVSDLDTATWQRLAESVGVS